MYALEYTEYTAAPLMVLPESRFGLTEVAEVVAEDACVWLQQRDAVHSGEAAQV